MSEVVTCAVCGKPIGPTESRFVDRAKGTTIQVHAQCKGKE